MLLGSVKDIEKNRKELLDEIGTLVRVLNAMSNHSACMQASSSLITHIVIPIGDSISSRQKHRYH